MTKSPRRVTALDVARAAGVSKTTVSYVLNKTPGQSIPDETRQKVLDAMAKLDYVPLTAARSLRRGRNDTVLLVLPEWPLGRVIPLVIDSLTVELEEKQLSLLTRRQRPGQPLRAVWHELAPAAVITLGEVTQDDRAAIEKAGIFAATALLASSAAVDDSVVVAQDLIGAIQVQHLAHRGHRRLGYAAPSDPRFASFFELRWEGARRACLDLGLDEPHLVQLGLSVDEAEKAVRTWTEKEPPVTGVVAYNDEFAAAVIAAAHRLRISIPDDLAVIGVDNDPLGGFMSPSLTTVDQHHEVVAAHLAAVVDAGIHGAPVPRPPRSEALSLVERESA